MAIYFAIAVLASLFWIIKDWIKLQEPPFKTQWKKYVGTLVAGVLYIFLKEWNIFQYISMVAVIVLVATCFDEITNFLFVWLPSKFKNKK